MGKKRFKYLSLVLCVVLICGSFVYIPKKNDVKANPAVAGIYVIAGILVSCGIAVEANNAGIFANEIYSRLNTDDQFYLDSQGNLASSSALERIAIKPETWNNVINVMKDVIGISPEANFEQTQFGKIYTTSNGSFAETSVAPFYTVVGASTKTIQIGQFSYEIHTIEPNNQYCIVTCPDGFKFKVGLGGNCGVNYTNAWNFYGPVMFWSTRVAPEQPTMHFLSYSTAGTYAGYTGGIGGVSVGENYSTYYGNEVYYLMHSHLGTSAPATATIDTTKYAEEIADTKTEDINLNIAQNLDLIVSQTADQITAIQDSTTGILTGLSSLSATITGAITEVITKVGEFATSVATGFTDTIAKLGEVVTSITAAPTVALNMQPLTLAGATLATKFPFCIPFDLVNSISTLNVAAVAPHWVINFDSSYFTGGGQVDIDFAQFEAWAVIIRWGLLIGFSLGLIMITRQIIGGE